MCFSATASFTASALLTTGGAVAVSRTTGSNQLPLASIPLIFGLQQGLEGLVWISKPLTAPYYFGMYGFLICAYGVWPILVPWATLWYQKNFRQDLPLLTIALLGTAVGMYFIFELNKGGVTASTLTHNICYSFYPAFWYGIGLVYISIVVAAGLLAKERFMQFFSVGLAAAFVASRFITSIAYASVWCFFGALLSSIIIHHFLSLKKGRSSIAPARA